MNVLVCPRCRYPLAIKTHGKNRVAGCSKCGGIWLGASATQTVEAALSPIARSAAATNERTAALAAVDEQAVAACAECKEPMQRHTVGPVEVDHCPQHGTWYDAGELNDVARILEQGTLDQGTPAQDPSEAIVEGQGGGLELDPHPPRAAHAPGRATGASFVPSSGAGGHRALSQDSLARARRIAGYCRSADHATERSHQEARAERSRRFFGCDRYGSDMGDVFDLVGDVLTDW